MRSEGYTTTQTSTGSPATGEFPVSLADGAVVQVRHLGQGPRVLVSHGNGLAIHAYRAFWSRLATSYQVVMFDFRHHGRGSPFKSPVRNWPQFIEDFDRIVGAIDRTMGPAPTFGAFHSMSALTSLLHAAEHPVLWKGLILFEPPAPPPVSHPLAEQFFTLHANLAEGASRRRRTFSAIGDLTRSFASRDAFRRLSSQTLDELSAATLRHVASGFELACDRDFEAETFRLRYLEGAWDRITRVKLPVRIVAGIPGRDESHCLSNIAQALATDAGFEFAAIDDATHFLQMEHPQQCADEVSSFVARLLQNPGG